MSARPPKAPRGRPPPMALARQTRSGDKPQERPTLPGARRAPVFTVQNEQRPLPPADFLMASKNPGLGGQMVTLSITGSAMTAAISRITLEMPLTRRQVVEARGQGMDERFLGNAPRGRSPAWKVQLPELGGGGLDAGEHRVVTAVEGALELDDLGPAGEGPGQAQGVHGGLGSGIGEAHALQLKTPADLLGEFALQGVRHRHQGPASGLLGHGPDDRRMGVADEHRPETHGEVHIFVAIHVPKLRPAGLADENRVGVHGPEIRTDAQGKGFTGPAVQFPGFGGPGSPRLQKILIVRDDGHKGLLDPRLRGNRRGAPERARTGGRRNGRPIEEDLGRAVETADP